MCAWRTRAVQKYCDSYFQMEALANSRKGKKYSNFRTVQQRLAMHFVHMSRQLKTGMGENGPRATGPRATGSSGMAQTGPQTGSIGVDPLAGTTPPGKNGAAPSTASAPHERPTATADGSENGDHSGDHDGCRPSLGAPDPTRKKGDHGIRADEPKVHENVSLRGSSKTKTGANTKVEGKSSGRVRKFLSRRNLTTSG